MNEIQLNGKSHKIRFNFNTLKDFKTINGGSALDIADLDVGTVLDLAYVGLKEAYRIECKENGKPNDFNLSIEDVGEMLDTSHAEQITGFFVSDMQAKKPKKQMERLQTVR